MRRAEHVINYALERLTLMTLNPVITKYRTPVTNRTTDCDWLPLVAASVSSRHTAGGILPPPEILNSPEIFSWCKFLNVIPALLADTAVFSVFVKNVAARCNFQAQNTPKYVCGRGFAPNHTGGKLQSSLRPLVGFQKAASRQGRRGKRGRRKRRKREGDSVTHFFFYNLTTAQQCIVAATYTRSLDL